ncbi:MAG: VanZ family protein [Geminicoccaceae bacterium]
MALFSSDRERRLWLWTLAVVVAILSTLGLAPTLSGVLREHGLLEASFALGMVLVGATIVTQGMRVRPGGAEIAVALGVTAAYLLVFVRMEAPPEERTHLIEYGVLGVFIYEALGERASQGRHVPVPPLLAVAATATLGLLDECIQAFLPSRVFDLLDILFNVLAGMMAVGGSMALAWARRRSEDPRGAP